MPAPPCSALHSVGRARASAGTAAAALAYTPTCSMRHGVPLIPDALPSMLLGVHALQQTRAYNAWSPAQRYFVEGDHVVTAEANRMFQFTGAYGCPDRRMHAGRRRGCGLRPVRARVGPHLAVMHAQSLQPQLHACMHVCVCGGGGGSLHSGGDVSLGMGKCASRQLCAFRVHALAVRHPAHG